jgi:3-methyladenine DNA glycosylase/8-oxoguanine DNA glycosylase
MKVFRYGHTEIEHLRGRDKKLGGAIDEIGMIEREVTPDIFTALVSSVVSQQISAKAAVTVRNRILDRFGAITPDVISSAGIGEIQECGLSTRKAGYIKGIGEAVTEGRLDLSELRELPDGEVIAQLSALKGVGTWTAEMILIFSMERPDILSWDDLAIRRGMMNLYGKKTLEKEQFERFRKRYSPFGSVASLYLWEISHR